MIALVAAALAGPPSAPPPRVPAPPPSERAELARRVLQQVTAAQAAGVSTGESVWAWSVRVRDAERASGAPLADIDHVDRMEKLLANTEAAVAAGTAAARDLDAARWYLAEARAGSASAPGPGAATAAPAALPPAGTPAIETCFQQCDRVWSACTTDAEHLRLGVGKVPPDAECTAAAEAKCGPGRSQTLIECRERELRTCAAARATSTCAKEQALCTARCR